MTEKVFKLTGVSGVNYYAKYKSVDSVFPEESAVYAFIKENIITSEILYIGETTNLNSRIKNHERLPEATALGCVKIVYFTFQPEKLKDIEADLIRRYTPPMNKVLP